MSREEGGSCRTCRICVVSKPLDIAIREIALAKSSISVVRIRVIEDAAREGSLGLGRDVRSDQSLGIGRRIGSIKSSNSIVHPTFVFQSSVSLLASCQTCSDAVSCVSWLLDPSISRVTFTVITGGLVVIVCGQGCDTSVWKV